VARDKENPSRRLFLPLKNNLGRDETGLAFTVESHTLASGIETSRVVWEGAPVTTSAEEAFAPDDDSEERGAVDGAKEFLNTLLASGPVPAKRVYAEGREAGHSERTIKRAKKYLGVVASKEGMKGPWFWALPSKEAKTPKKDEGVQPVCVAPFDLLRESGPLRDGDMAAVDEGELP
jgi:hypothetical protein